MRGRRLQSKKRMSINTTNAIPRTKALTTGSNQKAASMRIKAVELA